LISFRDLKKKQFILLTDIFFHTERSQNKKTLNSGFRKKSLLEKKFKNASNFEIKKLMPTFITFQTNLSFQIVRFVLNLVLKKVSHARF